MGTRQPINLIVGLKLTKCPNSQPRRNIPLLHAAFTFLSVTLILSFKETKDKILKMYLAGGIERESCWRKRAAGQRTVISVFALATLVTIDR